MKNIIKITAIILCLSAQASSVKIFKPNDIFNLTLNSQPSTGYTWNLSKYDNLKLQLIDIINTKQDNRLGSTLKTTWTFKTNKDVKAGESTTIEFIKKRNWENQIVKEYKYTIIFN